MTNLMPAPRPHRIALYGHDTQGLGHLRRNLVLAGAFAAEAPPGLGAEVLLLTGASEVGMFHRPRGVDAVVVPGVRKDASGDYSPRQLRGHLTDVLSFRSSMLSAALNAFEPDLVVVDKAPWGFGGELTEPLTQLRDRGTRLVLGLRDVLDDAATTRRQWHTEKSDVAVRELYDEVWVYGDPHVHDVRSATGMADDVASVTHHLGYLSADRLNAEERKQRPDTAGRDYVLVTVGGGQDGAEIARAAAAMPLPPGFDLIILTGPQLSRSEVRRVRRAAGNRREVQVHRFTPHGAAWLQGAAALICMGGANTVAEILDTQVPALVVPRTTPRAEQLVRATALADHDLLDVLTPDKVTTDRLAKWVGDAVTRRVERSGVNLGGIPAATARAGRLLEESLVPPQPPLLRALHQPTSIRRRGVRRLARALFDHEIRTSHVAI